MAEYIEREALLNEAKKRAKAFSCALIYEAIKEAPAADVVEVVRCRDCKHYGEDKEKGGFCKRTASPSMWRNDEAPLRPDDFCSYGERRTETLSSETKQTILDSFMKGSEA